jgi:tRNA A37 methylthiotransferase MiaB
MRIARISLVGFDELSDLLEVLLRKTQIYRIRLSSIGINEIDGRLLELLKELLTLLVQNMQLKLI